MVKKIVWIDEAGRWAWAWPVVAGACVILRHRFYNSNLYRALRDSKCVGESQREAQYEMLCVHRDRGDIVFAAGISSAQMIDQVGIKEANRLAMLSAISSLSSVILGEIDEIWIDGNDHYAFPELSHGFKVQEFICGDARHKIISAASIIAKVTRDRIMRKFSLIITGYGFEAHKGYGTAKHTESISLLGATDIHRLSFSPIQRLANKVSLIPHTPHLKKVN